MRFLNSIGFLTIIKIPGRFYLPAASYPSILPYFPVAGLIIGILNAAVFTSMNFVFPSLVAIIIMAGFETVLTGGIHVDGLADTFDGVFSGESDRSKIMEIMKKGDVGVFGVLAMIFNFALKISFFYFILRQLDIPEFTEIFYNSSNPVLVRFSENIQPYLVFLVFVVFAPVIGRLSMILLFYRHEPASKTGSLALAFKDRSNGDVFFVSSVFVLIVFSALSVLTQLSLLKSVFSPALSIEFIALIFALKSVAVFVLALLFSKRAGRFFTSKTGGLSGDVLGAVCTLTECVFLALSLISIRFL